MQSEYLLTIQGETADILRRLSADADCDAASVVASAIRFLAWGFVQQNQGRLVGALNPSNGEMQVVRVEVNEFGPADKQGGRGQSAN